MNCVTSGSHTVGGQAAKRATNATIEQTIEE